MLPRNAVVCPNCGTNWQHIDHVKAVERERFEVLRCAQRAHTVRQVFLALLAVVGIVVLWLLVRT